MIKFITMIVLAGLVLASPARASEYEKRVRIHCTADALHYCFSAVATASRKRIIACMVRNKHKLSPECRAHIRDAP